MNICGDHGSLNRRKIFKFATCFLPGKEWYDMVGSGYLSIYMDFHICIYEPSGDALQLNFGLHQENQKIHISVVKEEDLHTG